jgi:hypothetical protein
MRFLLLSSLVMISSCASQKRAASIRLPASDFALEKEITLDIDKNGTMDSVKVVSLKPEDEYATVQVNLGNDKVYSSTKMVAQYSLPGTSVEVLPNGSFKVIVDHSGIGTTMWDTEYTFSFKNEELILSGYTFSSFERNSNTSISCDLNLLTGHGFVTKNESAKKEVKIPEKKILFTDMTDTLDFKACKFK